MQDTCSDENDRLRLVCKKSDTVTEPAGTMPPPPPLPLQPATLDAELSLSTSIQLPGDRLTLPAPPTTSLGDMYDMIVYATQEVRTTADIGYKYTAYVMVNGDPNKYGTAREYFSTHDSTRTRTIFFKTIKRPLDAIQPVNGFWGFRSAGENVQCAFAR